MRRRDLHLIVHGSRTGVEESAEEAGEAQDVVDLVWIVGAPRGHDAHVTLGFLGLDLGVRIGHREDDGIPGHALDVTNREDARHAQPDEDVGLLHGVAEPALDLPGIRGRCHPALHEIHADGTPAMERAVLVDTDDVTDPAREQDFDGRRPRRAHAGDDHSELLRILADDAERVQQRSQDDDGGAVLVVVEHRDLEILAEPLLDLEAAWRRDILQIDAAEGGGEQLHGFHDLVAVLGGQADRKGIDSGELLEEHRLAFHHR